MFPKHFPFLCTAFIVHVVRTGQGFSTHAYRCSSVLITDHSLPTSTTYVAQFSLLYVLEIKFISLDFLVRTFSLKGEVSVQFSCFIFLCQHTSR